MSIAQRRRVGLREQLRHRHRRELRDRRSSPAGPRRRASSPRPSGASTSGRPDRASPGSVRASARRPRGCSASRARRSPGRAAAARRRRSRGSWSRSARPTPTGTRPGRSAVITPPPALHLGDDGLGDVALVEGVAALLLHETQRLGEGRIADARCRAAAPSPLRRKVAVESASARRPSTTLRRSLCRRSACPQPSSAMRAARSNVSLKVHRAEALQQRVVAGDRAGHRRRVHAVPRHAPSSRASW